MAEKTVEEKWQDKIAYAVKNLEELKDSAQTTVQEMAIRFIEIDKNDADSEAFKTEYYLKYKIAKTEVNCYARAMSSLRTSIAYG
jgi:hypothetical protein